MSNTLKENVSEKPKRGRPKVLPDELHVTFAKLGVYGESESRRSHLNTYYRTTAVQVLTGGSDTVPKEFAWLATERTIRTTIMSELGRIEDTDLLLEVARKLCEIRPTTKKAIRIIRDVRGARRAKADTLVLANRIIGVINDYSTQHPDASVEQIQNALATAQTQVEERT